MRLLHIRKTGRKARGVRLPASHQFLELIAALAALLLASGLLLLLLLLTTALLLAALLLATLLLATTLLAALGVAHFTSSHATLLCDTAQFRIYKTVRLGLGLSPVLPPATRRFRMTPRVTEPSAVATIILIVLCIATAAAVTTTTAPAAFLIFTHESPIFIALGHIGPVATRFTAVMISLCYLSLLLLSALC